MKTKFTKGLLVLGLLISGCGGSGPSSVNEVSAPTPKASHEHEFKVVLFAKDTDVSYVMSFWVDPNTNDFEEKAVPPTLLKAGESVEYTLNGYLLGNLSVLRQIGTGAAGYCTSQGGIESGMNCLKIQVFKDGKEVNRYLAPSPYYLGTPGNNFSPSVDAINEAN